MFHFFRLRRYQTLKPLVFDSLISLVSIQFAVLKSLVQFDVLKSLVQFAVLNSLVLFLSMNKGFKNTDEQGI